MLFRATLAVFKGTLAIFAIASVVFSPALAVFAIALGVMRGFLVRSRDQLGRLGDFGGVRSPMLFLLNALILLVVVLTSV